MSKNGHVFCSGDTLFLRLRSYNAYGSSQTLYHFFAVRGSENLEALLGNRHTSHALGSEGSVALSAKQNAPLFLRRQSDHDAQNSGGLSSGQATLILLFPVFVSDTQGIYTLIAWVFHVSSVYPLTSGRQARHQVVTLVMPVNVIL